MNIVSINSINYRSQSFQAKQPELKTKDDIIKYQAKAKNLDKITNGTSIATIITYFGALISGAIANSLKNPNALKIIIALGAISTLSAIATGVGMKKHNKMSEIADKAMEKLTQNNRLDEINRSFNNCVTRSRSRSISRSISRRLSHRI